MSKNNKSIIIIRKILLFSLLHKRQSTAKSIKSSVEKNERILLGKVLETFFCCVVELLEYSFLVV